MENWPVFKGSLSATIGVWKMEESFGLHSTYVTVILHFTNDDRLQHRFLGGQKLAPNETVAQTYRKLLASYELDLTDIYRTCVNGSSVVVDSFSNYDESTSTASKCQLSPPVHNLTSKQKYKPLKAVCLNTDLFEKASFHEHINEVVEDLDDAQCHPCISHDLKLILFNIVRETLVKSAEFQRMISLFQLFQSSTDAMASLSETVGQLFIPIEQTEWSSWISAVEYYCQHKHLLAQIAIQHNWEQLKDEENELLKGYLSIISVFRSSIKTLENNETPTVSWVYGIVRAINEKVNADNKSLSIQKMCKVAVKEMQKLAYVQEDPIFVISTFLDPATKRHLKQSDTAKAIELIADWLKVEDAELSMINMSQQEEKNSGEDPLLQMLDSFGPRQNDLTSFVRSFSELIYAEYQRQPERGKYSATTLRILQNASDVRYEGITNIAKIVLAVPTSNVGLESEFVQKHHHSQAKGNDMLDAKLRIYLNNCY
ncbi:Zinc finger BED domain-containing protein 4-like protein [Aphelenchoides bicaudatus]|nr:Zinc finger BED domain-containing protein 4-like protein [Aphelenchoides bicaudatus]